MRRALAPALAAAVALAGCAVLRTPRAGPEAEAWAEARGRHSRAVKLYDRFETHALATALWEPAEVRARRADQVAAWKAMTPPELAALAAAELDEEARWEEFLVSFLAADARDNDLDARASVWRIALLVEGEPERLPAEVKVLRMDGLMRDLYPFVHEHDTLYRVRFARTGKTRPAAVTLRIAGSEGRMDFAFGR